MKNVILIIISILCLIAIVLSIVFISKENDDIVCTDIVINIDDRGHSRYITNNEIIRILTEKGIYPIGKKMNSISVSKIEKEISKREYVENAECYKTTNNKVVLDIKQRIPLMRVINNNGEDFYIDINSFIIPNREKILQYSIIATGHIDRDFAKKELYNFAKYLKNEHFWNAQIEQINVLPNKGVELVPLVGDNIIYLGQLKRYEEKLDRLKEFYKQGLNKVGWNKYNRINLEISNQIICTKK